MRFRRHTPVVLATPPVKRLEHDADEMVWQLAEKRAAELADARRALVEAEATIGQLEAYLGAVRQINVRLNAQCARARRQASTLVEHLGHAISERDGYATSLALAHDAYASASEVLAAASVWRKVLAEADEDDPDDAWEGERHMDAAHALCRAVDAHAARMADAGGGQ